jgi:hypothetical protein
MAKWQFGIEFVFEIIFRLSLSGMTAAMEP